MRIVYQDESIINYDFKEIVRQILYTLKEDQNLNFGPRLKSSKTTKKELRETVIKQTQLLSKSTETLQDLKHKIIELKTKNDALREQLLEALGSEL